MRGIVEGGGKDVANSASDRVDESFFLHPPLQVICVNNIGDSLIVHLEATTIDGGV